MINGEYSVGRCYRCCIAKTEVALDPTLAHLETNPSAEMAPNELHRNWRGWVEQLMHSTCVHCAKRPILSPLIVIFSYLFRPLTRSLGVAISIAYC